jgi:hypothetical protein
MLLKNSNRFKHLSITASPQHLVDCRYLTHVGQFIRVSKLFTGLCFSSFGSTGVKSSK